MPNNLIRVKQLDQSELSGFFAQTAVNTGIIPPIVNNIGSGLFVSLSANQTIIGVKTFLDSINVSGTGTFNSLDLNNIDTLSLSGVDVTITSGVVTLTNPVSAPNLVYNTGDQTVSGVKTFATGVNINGNVGIGIGNNDFDLYVRKSAAGVTVNPDSNSIAVFEGSGNSHITILTSNSASVGVVLGSPADSFGSYLTWNHDNHALKLGTAKPSGFIQLLTNDEVEAVRITSGANVGIGTNNPSAKLHVVGNVKVSGNLTVNNTGVLLTGQNVFVLQGGTNEGNTTAADTNYIGLAGANIGYSSTAASRRVPILENCVARKASIILQQAAAGISTSNITGSIVNLTQGLTGIISQSMSSTNNGNFISFSNSNLNVPFSAGDNAAVFIHNPLAITNLRTLANVYFYN